ncbi:TPM domain-containing protein [Clostridium felsineum]|uniref:TPM domain-containing protein n=1 Tax=Clostridium felsineum TaxID=36839 RepID=UPI00098CDBD2|nr:TPM domain-containing protein [Clostridium felsineum]URZ17177.1 hypothetical protein CLFE_032290 [Clostridium felsineum DSM 794]
MKQKLKFIMVLLIVYLMLFSVAVSAAGNYIEDNANVLSANTIQTVNNNFTKVENNTGVKVKLETIKSLDGKNIRDVAMNMIDQNSSTKQVVFIVAVKEHKNKILSYGLNNVFNGSELDRIAGIPNGYFKSGDFNNGILKVGEAIDQDITTKAVRSGKATVKNDGLNRTVSPKKSYLGLIIFLIFALVIIILIIYKVKRNSEMRARKFARKNGLGYDGGNNGRYRSGNMAEDDGRYENYNNSYGEPRGNTTIINNGNNNDFVKGVIAGEILSSELHHHEDHYHNDYYRDDERLRNNDVTSSGDWTISSGESDWGSGASDSGSGSSDSGSSDW